SVGFQYSNMTRAESTNGAMAAPSGLAQNYFHNQAAPAPGSNLAPSTSASTYQNANPTDTLPVPCSGPNCGN
ncbi:hypothetical protein, partial [Helicobacter ailurogastricus]|uniref:hypothetical protein n=1 Tax=Helicobacter ailurogastricus TaxID=1578720 RepID=UPI0025568B2A